MEDTFLKSIIDLGGTVAVVGAFLWYMRDRNGRTEKIQTEMLNAIDRNTKVLIKVAIKHRLLEEADDLINE